MIRILHTADVHLDSPLKSLAMRDEGLRETVEAATRAAFVRIVETALSERVAALLIAGDLFDGRERSARTGAFLTGQLDRLRTADIRVFYIKGNHDAENPIAGTIDLPGNVHVFDARGGKVQLAEDIWVHGVSFADRHAPESLLPRFSAPVPGAVNIAMLHTSLAGAAGHDVYAPCTLGDLTGMGFDYWALGHVHKRQVHGVRDSGVSPWVVMPGMPQGRDIGEAGPKSASLLTIADGNIDVAEVQTSVVEFFTSSLDITGAQGDDELRRLLRDHMRVSAEALTAPAGVMRLTLAGAPSRYWQILRDRDYWGEQAMELARECLGQGTSVHGTSVHGTSVHGTSVHGTSVHGTSVHGTSVHGTSVHGTSVNGTSVLWLDKLLFDFAAPRVQEGTASATDELSATMSAVRCEPGFVTAARAELDEVVQDLPPTVRARLVPDNNAGGALAVRLAEAGARRVLARMKGTER